jgi:hypothetical protein
MRRWLFRAWVVATIAAVIAEVAWMAYMAFADTPMFLVFVAIAGGSIGWLLLGLWLSGIKKSAAPNPDKTLA